jgi:signal transduction histidine kinase
MTKGHIALRSEETELARILESALLPLAQQSARQGIELRVVADHGLPLVTVDRDKIAWAVSTLAGNALRYLPGSTDAQVGGSILVHLARAGSELSVAVQDDGPGIPEERLERLFDRKDGSGHATALTLLLVRDIVAAHGGRLEVRSQGGAEDHFTCVTLFLPLGPVLDRRAPGAI